MAKNIPLSTIGVKVSYAVETTAGSGHKELQFTRLHGIYSTPDFNASPSTADVTSFDNLEYTTKISLLKDIPDNLEFGVRLGQAFVDEWDTLMSTYNGGITDNKETWFCIDINGLDKSIYFTGKPISLGIPSMEANSGIDMTVYISPTGEPVFDTDPTYASEE